MSGTNGNDILLGNNGADSAFGFQGADLLTGQGGNDDLRGGKDGDVVLGGADADTLRGGNGDDYVEGGTGNDEVRGGAGNDTLYGGEGADFIRGGDGDDVIIYLSAAEGGDVVAWEAGTEIQVSAFGFGGGLVEGTGLVFGETFFTTNIAGAPPAGFGADGTGVFIQDLDTRNLWWDADGAGLRPAELIGEFRGVSLVADNFVVIG